MQVAGRTKVDDEDGDGDSVETLIATLDFLVFNACSLGRHAAPGDLDPYKKGR